MIKELLAYQEVDTELRNIELELLNSDERKKASQAKAFLKSVTENIAQIESKAEKLSNDYVKMQNDVLKLAEEIKEYDDVDDIDDLNQVSYIKKKAQELNDNIVMLDKAMKELKANMASTLQEYQQLRSKTKEAKSAYDEYGPKYNELKASKEAEINKINAKLKELSKGIDADIIEKYQQKRKDKIFPVLNKAKEISKHAYCRCGTELPVASYNSLKNSSIVECDNCHRLLYLED